MRSTQRLEPGTTKDTEGRTFPFSAALKTVIEAQHAEHERLKKKKGKVVPRVFFRMVANGGGGPLRPSRITSFIKAFKGACRRAGCPGRIPHNRHHTAVRNLERAGVPRFVAIKLTGTKPNRSPDARHRRRPRPARGGREAGCPGRRTLAPVASSCIRVASRPRRSAARQFVRQGAPERVAMRLRERRSTGVRVECRCKLR